jgi:hypothetical protein
MTAGILLETRDHEIARPLGYASAETKQLDESVRRLAAAVHDGKSTTAIGHRHH